MRAPWDPLQAHDPADLRHDDGPFHQLTAEEAAHLRDLEAAVQSTLAETAAASSEGNCHAGLL